MPIATCLRRLPTAGLLGLSLFGAPAAADAANIRFIKSGGAPGSFTDPTYWGGEAATGTNLPGDIIDTPTDTTNIILQGGSVATVPGAGHTFANFADLLTIRSGSTLNLDGSLDTTGTPVWLGQSPGTDTINHNTGTFNIGSLTFQSGGSSIYNLTDGTLTTGSINDTAGTSTINFDGGTLGTGSTNITVDFLNINPNAPAGNLGYTRSGGTLTVNDTLTLGGAAGGTGNLTQNGGTVNVGGDLLFGGDAAGTDRGGTYDLNGGTLTVGGDITEGDSGSPNSNIDAAQLYIDDPNALILTDPNATVTVQSFRTGDNQDGSFTFSSGQTVVTTGTLLVGTSADGDLTLEGTGNTAANMTVSDANGSAGSTLTIAAGADLQVNGGTDIGDANGTDGTMIVNGSLDQNARLYIGGNATGSTDSGSMGTVTVNTGGTVDVDGSNTEVGRNGTGILNIDGGTFNQNTNNLVIAQYADSDGTVTLDSGAINITAATSDLNMNQGTGTFTQNGGTTLVGRNVNMGNADTADHTITVNGGLFDVENAFNLIRGMADFTMGGGTVNVGSDFNMATTNTATTIATQANINGGLLNIGDVQNDSDLFIGNANNAAATATFTVAGGTVYVSDEIRIAQNGVDSSGSLNVSSGTVNVRSNAIVGVNGDGASTISGGILNVGVDMPTTAPSDFSSVTNTGNNGAQFLISANNGSTGIVSQTAGTVNVGDTIGNNSNDVVIGRDNGSNGTYNISGGLLSINDSAGNSGDLTVAGNENGATTAMGTLNVSGTADIDIDGRLRIGQEGTGIMTMTGGTIDVATNWILGQGGAADGTASVTGGTVTVNGVTDVGQGGDGSLTIGGTGVVDMTNGRLTLGANAGSSGELVVQATGLLDNVNPLQVGNNGAGFALIDGTVNAVNAVVNNDGDAVDAGELRGAGLIDLGGTGTLTIRANGVVEPGTTHDGTATGNSEIGVLTVDGDVTFATGSTLELFVALPDGIVTGAATLTPDEIAGLITLGSNPTPLVEHDALNVTGALNFADAANTISFTFDPGFVPAKGQWFDLFDFGALTGITAADFNGGQRFWSGSNPVGPFTGFPSLSASPATTSLRWDTSLFLSHGIIFVVPEPSRAVLLLAGVIACLVRRRR